MDKAWDFLAANPMAVVIAAGEIGFWVLILGGLLARYLLRWRRTGAVLLASTAVVDIGVLVATMIDLAGGGKATAVHGIAAVYLGFSVAFGPRLVRWADQRFAHRFAGGPPPDKPPKHGPERVRHEWREWGRCVLGCGIAAAVLLVLIFVVGTPEQTKPLWEATGWLPRLGLITVIWFVTGPLWQTLTTRSSRGTAERERVSS
ncbi:hypothetical protein [Amycolatopsis sp. CA-230715]|uniref:hypothetical protein n=1 Tax=Amycolatopsis sp. CA-230715 TaxID=2745196 RepID=UPI001C016DCD|nr:hypothetical protein [Amycolatopsis sp. CA-230715]